jgi:6-phosphogluconolactonase
MNISVYSENTWSLEFADIFLLSIKNVLKIKEKCTIFVTGGKSAAAVYRVLASASDFFLLRSVEIFLSDERLTGSSSVDSNYFSVMRNLFPMGIGPGFCFHQMYKYPEGHNKSVIRCQEEFPDHFDIGLLSVSDDGHIASIFPQANTMHDLSGRIALAKSTNHPYERLTITPKVLSETDLIFALAVGVKKKWVIDRILDATQVDPSLPATLLLNAKWIISR